MSKPGLRELDGMWSRHHAEWRDAAQVVSQWDEATATDPALLCHEVRGDWWQTLQDAGVTLLVTREYEHLAMALGAANGTPAVTYMRLPHPSGLVVDREAGAVFVASTRNPNQVYELAPVRGLLPRLDVNADHPHEHPLVPRRTAFFPGCLYLHDLAFVGGVLHGNSVGQNAVVRLQSDGQHERVWWPRCIETRAGPVFERNHIQLNSIAAGEDLESSFFSASSTEISARRPGHRNYPVDRRGVVFSGKSREPIARNLTRPHSARLQGGAVWVDNSGYGELVVVNDGGGTDVVAKLPGWTRGLCFHGDVAFVGTSRVIPRFRQYAPGLDVEASECGIHAVDTRNGTVLGSIVWPWGNQIFALDWMPSTLSGGFPFRVGSRPSPRREKGLFYAFDAPVGART